MVSTDTSHVDGKMYGSTMEMETHILMQEHVNLAEYR